MELFHGTRQRFETFDTAYKGTGESGDIDACWFTDNFKGAMSHARGYNRNTGTPLVYRCELTSDAILADYSRPLAEQPAIAERLRRFLPVAISTSICDGREWYALKTPNYQAVDRKTFSSGGHGICGNALIALYRSCGIHGVYDWERPETDHYLGGPSIVLFDFSALIIREVIEVGVVSVPA